MKRNQFSKLFLILLLCTGYIFAFAHIGSNAYETFAAKSNTYPKGTMIGPIDLSGVSRDDGLTLITKQIADWSSSAKLQLVYREQTYPLNNDIFTFNIQESVLVAKDGVLNPLLVQINKQELQEAIVIFVPSGTVTDKLETDLLSAAQLLTKQIDIDMSEYLVQTAEKEVLSTVRVAIDTDLLLAEKTAEFPLPAETSFSFNQYSAELNIGRLPADIINMLSAGMYQLVLQTNFTIQERHIGMELADQIPLGYEAKIDSGLKWDFKFFNPNKEDFTIRITQQDGTVQLDLLGYPFVNKYEIELSHEQTFEPKTIKRYDPLLMPGETNEKNSGKNGSYIEVYRKTLSSAGEVLGKELISKDFYAPQYRIIVEGLINNVVESEESVEDVINDDAILSEDDSDQVSEDNIAEDDLIKEGTENIETDIEEDQQN